MAVCMRASRGTCLPVDVAAASQFTLNCSLREISALGGMAELIVSRHFGSSTCPRPLTNLLPWRLGSWIRVVYRSAACLSGPRWRIGGPEARFYWKWQTGRKSMDSKATGDTFETIVEVLQGSAIFMEMKKDLQVFNGERTLLSTRFGCKQKLECPTLLCTVPSINSGRYVSDRLFYFYVVSSLLFSLDILEGNCQATHFAPLWYEEEPTYLPAGVWLGN